MKAVFNSIGTRSNADFILTKEGEVSSFAQVISTTEKALRMEFPMLPFMRQFRNDGGVDFIIHDLDVFLSPEFSVFLDRIAKSLSDEQYMLLGFVPAERAKNIARDVVCTTTVATLFSHGLNMKNMGNEILIADTTSLSHKLKYPSVAFDTYAQAA